EAAKAEKEIGQIDVAKAEKDRIAAKHRRDKALANKQGILKKIQQAREGIGETKLLHRALNNELGRLSDETKTSSGAVRSLHNELSSLDELAGELHELCVRENKKRRALKTEISR
ncbi:unnamed protein product, partial [Amoebophrya sp. A25]